MLCHLGSLHVLMSYLGAVGTLMAGSGLTDALQTCYGLASVSQMMSGKAYARAVCGHMLAHSALHTLLLHVIVNNNQAVSAEMLDELHHLYISLLEHSFVLSDDPAFIPDCVEKLHNLLNARKADLSTCGRTAMLWIQYLDYIQILKDFIRADLTCVFVDKCGLKLFVEIV